MSTPNCSIGSCQLYAVFSLSKLFCHLFTYPLLSLSYSTLTGLLYSIRRNDRQGVSKLVSRFTKSSLRSPFAVCLLIRIACKLIEGDPEGKASQV